MHGPQRMPDCSSTHDDTDREYRRREQAANKDPGHDKLWLAGDLIAAPGKAI
jgi:hypothetical protein